MANVRYVLCSLDVIKAKSNYELKVLVENCARQQKPQDDLDATLMRILFSNRYEKDNRFVGEEHFEQFKEYKAKNILTLLQRLEKDCPMIKDYYSAICEFVHPIILSILALS